MGCAIMIVFWLVAFIVFLVIEAVTAGLTSIYFAAGALAALLSAALGAPDWLQAVWFIVLSGVTLYFTRPLAKKYVNSRRLATNADRMIGTVCIVTEDIDNLAGTGAAVAGGKIWTARSVDGTPIPKGSTVRVCAIEGVKLMVAPADGPSDQTDKAENETAAAI